MEASQASTDVPETVFQGTFRRMVESQFDGEDPEYKSSVLATLALDLRKKFNGNWIYAKSLDGKTNFTAQ